MVDKNQTSDKPEWKNRFWEKLAYLIGGLVIGFIIIGVN